MSTEHTVKKGEHISSIAKRYGYSNWRLIYDHPDNSELRQQRPNPNVLHKGDKIVIPDKDLKSIECETEQRHRFRLELHNLLLRIIVRRYGRPITNKRYELRIGERISPTIYRGQTDDEGLVEQRINNDAQRGELIVWDDNTDPPKVIFKQNIRIGHIDPVDCSTGVQSRLRNLGFYKGAIDGEDGPKTQDAIRAFQKKHGLEVNGVAGDETRQKLIEEHGS
jgi:putative peptidoglycan binding protein/LysM domain-containing protein